MRLSRTLPATAEAVRTARNSVMAVLIEVPCTTTVVETARLLVSELATNVVVHARCESFVLEVDVDEPWARISVRDADEHLPSPREADVLDTSGRGLALVGDLADRWDCEATTDPAGKVVWFELACA